MKLSFWELVPFLFIFFCHTNHMSDLFEKAWEGNFTKNQKKIKIGRKT